MLESFNSEKFDYQRLSPEEQEKRGILGRLVGVIADTVKPTRNGRKYSGALWEKVFSDPIMQERIDNRVCFGELGHPADREETDMEKIALCLAEKPKKGKDGKIYGVFDILDTPNGRILKTLCDYGCNIGVSSRGSGDLITDFDGNESVDEDTYDCQGWDAVLIPAVKEARMQYVTESLNKVKYNKTLRQRLAESIQKASEDDRKVMTESLETLGVKLNEDDLHQKFRKDAKDQYKSFTTKKDAYDKKASEVEKDLKDLGAEEEKIDKYKDILLGKAPEFKLTKGHNNLERQKYPFYITVYEGTSYYHPEEGGYYQPGLEPYYSEGYQTFEEAQEALQKYLEENSSTTVSFNPSNVAVNDDNYSYSESEEEYRPIYDNKNRLIGAIASGKYIGEEEQVWIEPSKHYLSRQRGYEMYESLNESKTTMYLRKKDLPEEQVEDFLDALASDATLSYDAKGDRITISGEDTNIWNIAHRFDLQWKLRDIDENLSESLDESAESRELANIVYDTLMNNKQFAQFDADAVDDQEIENDSITFTYNGKPYRIDVMAIDEAQNTAVENNEAMVEELQKSLKANKELQEKLVELQEKLSVSYAKESKLEEQIDKQKSAINNLTRTANKVVALKEKITTLENNAKVLEEKLQERDNSVKRLSESVEAYKENRSSLQETLSKQRESSKSLNEELTNLKSENTKLTESLESLKKDFSIKKTEYSNKLAESNKLVEKYKRIASKSVDKYIESQAIRLGVNSNEIKNKLPESYTFNDIDNACEEVMQHKIGLNKLPFNTMLTENIHIKATPSKKDKLALNPLIDDEVDDQLMQWAKLK